MLTLLPTLTLLNLTCHKRINDKGKLKKKRTGVLPCHLNRERQLTKLTNKENEQSEHNQQHKNHCNSSHSLNDIHACAALDSSIIVLRYNFYKLFFFN